VNKLVLGLVATIVALLVPANALAEFRRIEIKTLGMD
jgi:hypothetical protein